MNKDIFDILNEVANGTKFVETAHGEILNIIKSIDTFDFDAEALNLQDQIKFRMLMSTGNILIKPVIE